MSKDTSNNNNKTKQALGLGIKALLNNINDELNETASNLPSVNSDKTAAQVGGRISIDLIDVNPSQPRQDFNEQALQELSDSIKLHDIIQPITVSRLPNGRYRLISGERRLRASKLAGLTTIPAYIRSVDNQELIEMALLENLQREDLNAIEIAISYKQLMEECSLTQEQVSERMKKDRSTVTNYLRLLNLPPVIQKSVRDNEISMGHARAILSLKNVDEQLFIFREIKEKALSVRQVEALVKSFQNNNKPQPNKEKPTSLSPVFKRIEDNMASLFETKVHLDRKKNGKGSLTIEFYSDEDLERIMNVLNL